MQKKNRRLYLNSQHELSISTETIPVPGPGEVLIKIEANGICGSDIHFYHEGKLGNFVVDQPYVPGHESSGSVVESGPGAKIFHPGDRVVIEPGIACGHCHACKTGRYNLCQNVVFLSAPPINGTFCDYIAVNENFVFKIPDSLSFEHAALAEPAAVAIHAVNRARLSLGDTGVIVGAGPIGLLTLQAFKAAGGGHAICVDLIKSRLEIASALGADETICPVPGETDLCDIGDTIFETAGSRVTTAQLFRMARRGGRIVQVGWPDGNTVNMNIADLMDKELDYMGVNRYANAFETAITWLADGRINADKMITHKFSFDNAPEAFDWALNHPQETIKVLVKN